VEEGKYGITTCVLNICSRDRITCSKTERMQKIKSGGKCAEK